VPWEESASSMMKLLIAHGADLNAVDGNGRTAADRASLAGRLDRALFLLGAGTAVPDRARFVGKARNRALVRAVAEGGTEAAENLLNQGADPDARDESGRTALMLADANEYSDEKVRLMLRHGASVNLS